MKLVSALAIAAAMSFAQNTPAAAQDGIPGPEQDSYIWLEEARSDKALDWVRAENERTMDLLAGDPRYDAVKAEALAMKDAIAAGEYHPFTGPINKQDGTPWLAEGEVADDGTLAGMDFYVEGLTGEIPN